MPKHEKVTPEKGYMDWVSRDTEMVDPSDIVLSPTFHYHGNSEGVYN